MKEKKLISINLDGTLLNDNQNVSSYTIKVLKECQKKGNKILINTSRGISEIPDSINKINADYLSCFSGNYITFKDNVIIDNYISSDDLEKIVDYLVNNKFHFKLHCSDGIFEFNKKIKKELKNKKCYEIYINCNEIKKLKKFLISYNLVLNCHCKNYYKIVKINTNKVNAIKTITNLNNKLKVISFGDDITDYETLFFSEIGIKMKNSTKDLDDIIFWTESNNDDGVAKFLSNFYNLNLSSNYNKVKILDCTLRDGGHLNKCNFGFENIKFIINKLIKANTDIIEIGFLEDCNYDCNVSKYNSILDAENLLKEIDCKDSMISVLTQVDKFDINKLTKCSGKVKLIRVSFHYGLLNDAINFCKIVKQNGYFCSLNPINFSGYNNDQIIDLIKEVNKLKLDYFTIVDTFGELLNNDFNNKLNLINNLLRKDINVGLHLHDNLSSSFSTAQILIQKNTRFNEVIVDSSLDGMGRDPGNLKTELLMYHLNTQNDKYNLIYIYDLLQNEIKKMKLEYKWGYDFSYSISAFEKTHRSYAEYLKKQKLDYQQIEKCIKMIPNENKIKYEEKIIENIFLNLKGE